MPEEPKSNEAQEGLIWGVLAYIYAFCFVPLLFKRDNPFVLFHGRQGLVIFLGEVIIAIGVRPIVPFLGNLLLIVFAAISLYGIYNVVRGECKEIPVISDIARQTQIS